MDVLSKLLVGIILQYLSYQILLYDLNLYKVICKLHLKNLEKKLNTADLPASDLSLLLYSL